MNRTRVDVRRTGLRGRTLPALLFLLMGLGVAAAADEAPRLRVSENGRWLVRADGKPVFLLCDTAWRLGMQPRREDAVEYLQTRRAQGFNAVTFVAFDPTVATNAYGDAPFHLADRRMDPTRPLVTPGADPSRPDEYDYWDHLDFLVERTRRLGLHLIVLPAWGNTTAGGYLGEPGPQILFGQENARVHGRWIGARYRDQPHVVWMLGGDRSAVNPGPPERDYRAVFRAMAEGLVEGAGPSALISYHPRKGAAGPISARPQSSAWFHHDRWLAFNSIQNWPEHQIEAVEHDWALAPPKPTWVFEPRYEAFYRPPYKESDWGEWQVRQQAYQSVFSGAFGFTYGHERVFGFGASGADWKGRLRDPGAEQMRHLAGLMGSLSPADYLDRVPDPDLIDGNPGRSARLKSDRLVATRGAGGRFALVYSAAGRPVPVRLDRLSGDRLQASWFNPRDGVSTDAGVVDRAGVHTFTPPSHGDGDDWVLVLKASGAGTKDDGRGPRDKGQE